MGDLDAIGIQVQPSKDRDHDTRVVVATCVAVFFADAAKISAATLKGKVVEILHDSGAVTRWEFNALSTAMAATDAIVEGGGVTFEGADNCKSTVSWLLGKIPV